MVFTNIEHAVWLREQARLNRPYWYGTYYLECSEELLQKKAKQYPSHYGASRMPKYRQHIAEGQICGDCVNGAIKGAVWSELGRRKPVYKSHDCPDTNADGMFEYCKKIGMEWGAISSLPDEPGIAVRMAGHVGVYVGNGEVVEWRGFAYGCVVTRLAERPWLHWYRLPWTEYVASSAEQDGTLPEMRSLKKGCRGEDVRMLQEKLLKLGYSCGKWGADGDFGNDTENAMKAFQTAAGLTADGVVGKATEAALDKALNELVVGYRVKKGSWNVRIGPGTQYEAVGTVKGGDKLPAVDAEGWVPVVFEGAVRWISGKAVEA